MATKIEIRCTEEFKALVKSHCDKKDISMTTFIKDAIFDKMKKIKED